MEQKETLDIDDSSHELNVIKQTRKQKIRYNLEYLQSYVKDNNIQLLQEYSGNIKRETTIISKCLTDGCENSSSKTFRMLLNSGSYCKVCTEKNRYNKMKATNMERRGVENPFQDPGVRDKMKATNMEQYGVENPFQDSGVREKMKATNMERRGVEYPSQDPGVRDKMKATNMEQYGVENPFQDSGVREKVKATNMERYGVEHPMQNAEVSEKVSHNAYKAYDYKYPSGKTIRLQGYEKFAIDDLLAQKINEDDIITKRTDVPECFYKDSEGNIHRYYVDILIQSQKLCIEVKSTWTLEKNKEKVVFTKKALEDLGYKCEIWVYDGKGVRIEKIC